MSKAEVLKDEDGFISSVDVVDLTTQLGKSGLDERENRLKDAAVKRMLSRLAPLCHHTDGCWQTRSSYRAATRSR